MIIPIQREGASSPSNYFNSTNPTTSKTSSSSYTSKKSVRITPKITDIEILPRQKSQQQQQQQNGQNGVHTTVPVSILKSSNNDTWNDMSALKMFESNNQRWARDDMDDFLLPSLKSPSLLRDKFDNFSHRSQQSHAMNPSSMFRHMDLMDHHPIKIDTFVTEADRYVLTLNVQQFKPDEIQVKVTDDTISVTGKHEEKQDEANFNCQEYSRKHTLPAGVTANDVKCALSLGGILTISATRKEQQPALDQQRERTIPIKHSGLPAIRV